MTPQEFYLKQSTFSDPGKYAYLFDALPDDLPSLCAAIRGIYVHYWSGYKVSEEQKLDVDARYMEDILTKIAMRDERPLMEHRPKEKRFVGCCRDAALLLCSMLRYKGIPSRTRVGFARYIRISETPFIVDHVVTEYWYEGRWKLVDAEQGEALIRINKIDFDVLDIPRDQFLVGGRAWQMIHNGGEEPDLFGADPSDTFFRGEWAIRTRLILDLAAMNRVEPLLWDTWNWMENHAVLSDENRQSLHQAAAATQEDDSAFDQMQQMFQMEGLHTPQTVVCYSPAQDDHEVTLKF